MGHKRDQESFWSWLRQLRMRTLLLIMCPCVLVTPVLVMWLLPSVTSIGGGAGETIDSADTARRVLGLIDFDHLSGNASDWLNLRNTAFYTVG